MHIETAARASGGVGRRSADRPWAVGALLTVFVSALAVTLARNPGGVMLSSDPGYRPVPIPLLLAPAALTIAATLLLPRGEGAGPSSRASLCGCPWRPPSWWLSP